MRITRFLCYFSIEKEREQSLRIIDCTCFFLDSLLFLVKMKVEMNLGQPLPSSYTIKRLD